MRSIKGDILLEVLELEKTKDTPYVKLEPETGLIQFEGESFPENAHEFYSPILAWLTIFLSRCRGKSVTANFDLYYFNSSSSKCLLDIFELSEQFIERKCEVTVNWIHDKDDEDMKDTGWDFKEDFTGAFNFVVKE